MRNQSGDSSWTSPDVHEGKKHEQSTDHHVAKEVGIGSAATYRRHKKVLEQVKQEAPELMSYIENGDLTIAEVKKELKRRCPTPAAPSTRVGQWPPIR